MKKVLSAVLVVFAAIAFSLPSAYADHKGGGSKCSKCAYQEKECKVSKLKKKMSMYWAYKDELKLTEDQLMKIADIKHAALKQMIRQDAEVKVAKVDVKTELWQDQIDTAKVNPLIDAKYAAKAQLAKTMVQAMADAQAVLTPEQRAQMKEIKTDRYISESGIRGSKCDGKHCPFAGKKQA